MHIRMHGARARVHYACVCMCTRARCVRVCLMYARLRTHACRDIVKSRAPPQAAQSTLPALLGPGAMKGGIARVGREGFAVTL